MKNVVPSKYMCRTIYRPTDRTVALDMNTMFEQGYRVVSTASIGRGDTLSITYERIDE